MPTFHITRTQAFLNAIAADTRRKLAPALFVGDSWFQYPLRSYRDLQGRISHHFRDRLIGIDDSYPGRDADEVPGLAKRWFNLAAELKGLQRPFQLILLSMGGNDIIGQDFGRHLFETDQTQTPDWPWQPDIPEVCLRRINFTELSQSFAIVRAAYEVMIQLRDSQAPGAHILTHTYADITPSPTPFKFAGLPITGPWLHEPLMRVGISEEIEQRALSRWLLASFAALLADIAEDTPNFVVLDSRQELPDYAGWWDNEIHPLGKGFKHLADTYWIPAVDAAL